MPDFLYAALIALTNNIDNIGAWIAFSLKGIKITNWINLWISVLTFAISATAAFLGELLHGRIDWGICSYVSMAMFIGMGLWFLSEPLRKRRKQKRAATTLGKIVDHPEEADIDRSKSIDFKEATFLGIALSINNVGGSFSAGMIGVNSLLVGLLSAIISFAALWAGNRLSGFFQRFKFSEYANVISGIILILIGIKQVI